MRPLNNMPRHDVRSWVRLALQAAAGAGLLSAAPLASAQEWIFDPRVELQAIYNDNIRVTSIPGQEIEVYGPGVDAQVTARKESQAWAIEATPHIATNYFPDAKSEDYTDYYFDTRGERRTQRTRTSAIFQFADESVVSSELPVADFPGIDLGQVVSGDAGEVTIRNRRTLYTAQPSFSFDWTERRHLTLDAHYTDVKFDNRLFEQVGFTDSGLAAGIVWDFSQRAKFSVDVLGAVYSPDDGSKDTTSTGLMAEWRMAPSETMAYYFRLGGNHAQRDATGTAAEVSTSSFNGGVGVAWTYQVSTFVIDALRSTSPSSQGAVVNRDELRLRLTRAFSPKVTGYVAARGIRTTGVESAVVDVRERKYYTGRTGFEWRMTRQFSLDGAYEYKWQKYDGDPTNAASNGVTLSVVYQPRRLLK
jgi:hypothetical protein